MIRLVNKNLTKRLASDILRPILPKIFLHGRIINDKHADRNETMTSLAELFLTNAADSYLFLTGKILQLLLGIYLVCGLTFVWNRKKSTPKLFIPLGLVLLSVVIVDSGIIFKFLRRHFFSTSSIFFAQFVRRISWGFYILEYLSLAFFIKNFIYPQRSQPTYQRVGVISGALFASLFLASSIFFYDDPNGLIPFISDYISAHIAFFSIMLAIVPAIVRATRTVLGGHLPSILKYQARTFIFALIIPYYALYCLTFNPFSLLPLWLVDNAFINSFYTFLLAGALFYCTRKMVGLRFLNINDHVKSNQRFDFVNDFKDILEQLSHAVSLTELKHIAQAFCKEAFKIPGDKIVLAVRATEEGRGNNNGNGGNGNGAEEGNSRAAVVERFIAQQSSSGDPSILIHTIRKQRILIRDEIEFSNFYEPTPSQTALLSFMRSINADIFLPIFERQAIVAYILVERNARPNRLYSDVERDEMVIFAGYLGNVINLLRNKNLDALMIENREIREELYLKHQELSQFKESVRSFIRSAKTRKIGILFYKRSRFSLGNQAAQELMSIDPNLHEGHPLAIDLKNLARSVHKYRTAQTVMSRDTNGTRLMLSAVPSLDDNSIIILAYHPDIADILVMHEDILRDPSRWDYVLYLETTQSGKLINRLLPGSGSTLLSFKIDLLKTALSRRATLLKIPHEDLMPTVELLHHVSLRHMLHVIQLTGQEKGHEVAIKLFGINPLLAEHNEPTDGLLERLNNIGTLFIENIHYLSLETQNHLAEYLRYGIFSVFRSDRKAASNVRIICSTNQDLTALVEQGNFSPQLCNELQKMTLTLPSMLTLPSEELASLAEGFSEQALNNASPLKQLVALSEKEKEKILKQSPASIHELKQQVLYTLTNKTAKKQFASFSEDIEFDPAYDISDPEIARAVRLGKHALKDPQLMALLWHKFKNQTTIAQLLRVNRSSVNRRCKDFALAELESEQ